MLLPFKTMLLLERARGRKSGGPPLLASSFKVQRNTAHNQSSGSAVAPGLKAHNAREPLKVHSASGTQLLTIPCGRGTIHRMPICRSGHVVRAGPWPGTAPVSPLPSPKAGPCSNKRAEAVPDTGAHINFGAPAVLQKWPSLNKERISSASPYSVAEGTLDECIRQFSTKPISQQHLYEIHTAPQGELVTAVLSAKQIIELARLRDFL
jgi:hypothetical protein